MTSLLTNSSAMTALQTLSSMSKEMSTTQARISTGKRVSSASDNAAYWSIATSMRAEKKTLSAVQDALGLGASILDTTATALSNAIETTKEIKALYAARATPGTDQTAIDAEIVEKKAQIVEFAKSANFNGVNLLATGADAASMVTGYVSGTGLTTMSVAAYDLEGALAAATDVNAVATALDAMQSAAARFGASAARVDGQKAFTAALMDSIDRGIGQLVDADMGKESARLAALQVQQQLTIQALSIANQNTQSILGLFR